MEYMTLPYDCVHQIRVTFWIQNEAEKGKAKRVKSNQNNCHLIKSKPKFLKSKNKR